MKLSVQYGGYFRARFQHAVESRAASMFLLCAFFFTVAAAGFSGFIQKWALRDGVPEFGIERMLHATASKPFIYRQLGPWMAELADRVLPDRIKNYAAKIHPENTFVRVTAVTDPELHFRYLFIYYLSFSCLFSSLFVLRQVILDYGGGKVAAILAPASFMISFPYLQTVGGYFYDCIELLFLSLAFLIASRGKMYKTVALVIPATLNKETFFFFIPSLYPLLRYHYPKKKVLISMASAICASGIVNVLMKQAFWNAPGEVAWFQLLKNFHNYLMPCSYCKLEATYGVIGPSGLFIGSIAVMVVVLARGWPMCPPRLREHLLIAAAINYPLFFAFAATGELRNLSFLFVGFVILIAFAVDRFREPGPALHCVGSEQANSRAYPHEKGRQWL